MFPILSQIITLYQKVDTSLNQPNRNPKTQRKKGNPAIKDGGFVYFFQLMHSKNQIIFHLI